MMEEALENLAFGDSEIDSMFAYATGGGQKVRPKILLLSCEAVGGDAKKAVPAATAVEFMHKFTLVHDDIVDRDELRRGKKAFYRKYGRDYAIFMGDFICSEAFERMREIAGEDQNKQYSCYALLSSAFYKLCLGELLDISMSKFMTEDEYLNIVYLKSAAIIEAAARMGALLGGGTQDEQQTLADFGKNFAIAMQILNDIKDTMVTEKRSSDRKCSDIQEGKWNILLINTFERTSYRNKRELLKLMNKTAKSKQDIKDVQRMIIDYKSVDYARGLAETYFKKARLGLKNLKMSKARDALLSLSDIDVDMIYWKGK